MTVKVPVQFTSRSGHQLMGIFHQADKADEKDVGIILLSPGIKNRVAPHRLYVKMADKFTEMGFSVLRFDPEGIGDSEGEIVEKLTADVLGSVEYGRFVDSTIDAINWMEKEYKISRFILGGLCGGAITGLLTAAKDKRVDSLLGLGIPAISSGVTRMDPYKYISKGELSGLREGYFENAFCLKKWWRFVTFKSDYKMILKALMLTFKTDDKDQEKSHSNKNMQQGETNLNPLFVKSLFDMLSSNKKICLIFSGADRLYWEFEEKFVKPFHEEFQEYKDDCEVYVVPSANHIFSFPEWEKDMMKSACNWLSAEYGRYHNEN